MYNLEKLIKVSCSDYAVSNWYTYKNEIKILGLTLRKAGVYQEIWNTYIGDAPKNHIVKDGVVYEVPEVILFYQSDITKIYYFDTYDKAIEFAKEVTKEGKWIK